MTSPADPRAILYQALAQRVTTTFTGTSSRLLLFLDLGAVMKPRQISELLMEMAPDLKRMGWLIDLHHRGAMVWHIFPPSAPPAPPPGATSQSR